MTAEPCRRVRGDGQWAAETRRSARFIDSGYVLLTDWKTFLSRDSSAREGSRLTIAFARRPTESA